MYKSKIIENESMMWQDFVGWNNGNAGRLGRAPNNTTYHIILENYDTPWRSNVKIGTNEFKDITRINFNFAEWMAKFQCQFEGGKYLFNSRKKARKCKKEIDKILNNCQPKHTTRGLRSSYFEGLERLMPTGTITYPRASGRSLWRMADTLRSANEYTLNFDNSHQITADASEFVILDGSEISVDTNASSILDEITYPVTIERDD